MRGQLAMISGLLVLLSGTVLYKIEHAESVLERTRVLPDPSGAVRRPSGAVRLAAGLSDEVQSFANRSVVFTAPVRDPFSYVLPKPPPPALPIQHAPTPAPSKVRQPPPPRRLDRKDVVVHGFHHDRSGARLRVFVSYKDDLRIVEAGSELEPGIVVYEVTPSGMRIETEDHRERESFELPQ